VHFRFAFFFFLPFSFFAPVLPFTVYTFATFATIAYLATQTLSFVLFHRGEERMRGRGERKEATGRL
jgi:hypothetical protein